MPPDTLLTQDELDYIQDVQHSPQFDMAEAMTSLLVNGDSRIQGLLTRLVAHEQVTLQAHVDNQQISIPLQLIEDEFHTLQLQLGAPDIFEIGPRLRPWRLTLDPPCALLDAHGDDGGLWVCDISVKGVLVQVRDLPDAPDVFTLRFAPDGVCPIELHGKLGRRIDGSKAAYDLSGTAQEDIERLRDFILHKHRLAHPELHAQMPG
ncbi:hypothetical protein [Pseudomonas fulva]|uniref:hypothetical protein n=1 Tax=Pseudomonas fulva TaxID=47880 RepID=UPI0018A8997A|nr:hypothetical protein [Pseudomonas fulva]MBF8775157.1 hypothetical protein [Pseudomonas fulva]